MKLRLLSAVAVVLVVAVLAGRANAAPTPVYSVTCSAANAGLVEGTWQKAKLSQIRVEWVATTGSFDPITIPISSPTPPKGSVTASPRGAGGGPTSATVTFTHVDGSTDPPVTVPCQ
jgi:hypothetical protein